MLSHRLLTFYLSVIVYIRNIIYTETAIDDEKNGN